MGKPALTLPCKYSLNDFTPSGDSYHCSSCDHHLQDFRSFGQEELNQAISAAGPKTCGIFLPSQLATQSRSYSLGLSRRMGFSLLGILGFISPAVLTSCNDDNADNAKRQQREAFDKLQFPLYLKGTLTDSKTGKIIPNAAVSLSQSDKTVLTGKTDAKGKFSITVNEGDLSSDNFELILKQQGYKSDTVSLTTGKDAKSLKHLNLTLEVSPHCTDTAVEGKVEFAGVPATVEKPMSGERIPMPREKTTKVSMKGKVALPDPPPVTGISVLPPPEETPTEKE